MHWRLIDSGPCGASYNMALDEALAASVRKGASPPVLRLYGWDRPSLSIGCFQKVSDLDLRYCSEKGVPVVRRPTGGRAVLHGSELTYSFSVRTDRGVFSKGLLDSYKKLGAAFELAFRKTGLRTEIRQQREKGGVLAGSPLCFRSGSYGELLFGGKKLVGSAQKRWQDGLLQQGSIPYLHDEEALRGVFRLGTGLLPGDFMTGLKEALPGLDEAVFKSTVAASFEETFSIRLVPSHPSQEELSLALELQELKYLLPQWTLRR